MPGASKDWYSPPKGVELVESLYGGSCQAPLRLPLVQRRGGFPRRVDVFASDDAAFGGSVGAPIELSVAPDSYLERLEFPCGKCPACMNFRKRRYERAAIGWFRSTALTVLGTLTFGNRWFAQRCADEREMAVAALSLNLPHLSGEQLAAHEAALRAEELPTRYCPDIDRHFRDARAWLSAERSAMLKRFRVALRRNPVFKGVVLRARLEVLELGSRRGRLHAHLLWHFDNVPSGFVRTLRKWLKTDWQRRRGVGFVDLHGVKDDEQARYQCKYLGKFEDLGNGKKLYIGSGNPVPQSNGYLAKGYRRWLATLPEPGPDEALGNAQGEVPASAPDGADILLWPSGRNMGKSHG